MGVPCFMGAGRAAAITLAQFQTPFGILTNFDTTEAFAATTCRAAATVSFMGALVDANGTSRVTMFRKNNADTALSPTITDSTAGAYYDTTHSASLAVSDTFNFNLRGTAPSYIPYCVFFKHQTTGAASANYYGYSNNPFIGAGTVNFMSIASGVFSTTEANVAMTMRTAGSISFGSVTVTAANANAATVVSRKNGAVGAASIPIGAGLTGTFVDTTNSDTFTSGDTFNFRYTATTAGGGRYQGSCFVQFTGSNVELATIAPQWTANASNQFIALMGGVYTALVTTEALVQMKLGVSGVLSRLRLMIDSNSMTAASTVALRKNGATATSTVTIGIGATGAFEDTTHADAFSDLDTLNFIITGGTSGAIIATGGFFVLSQIGLGVPIWDTPIFRRGSVAY